MNKFAAIIHLISGIGYIYVMGYMTLRDLWRGRKVAKPALSGLFASALALIGFTCGPHHIVHAFHLLHGEMEVQPLDMITVLMMVPPLATFVWLRTESDRGGKGDRYLKGTLPMIALSHPGVAFGMVAAIWTTITLHTPVGIDKHSFIQFALVGMYLFIAKLMCKAQVNNWLKDSGWSVSGLSLAGIFTTCALTHAAYAFYEAGGLYKYDWHIVLIDGLGIVAAIGLCVASYLISPYKSFKDRGMERSPMTTEK